MKEKLTQQYLKECVTYNHETGIFTWNVRPLSHFKNERVWKIWNTRFSLMKPVNISSGGYLRIQINNNRYFPHRLAFLYMDGYIPENQVDHIDRDRLNNKWNNLREVSNQCNSQNCNLSKINTSGVCGVDYIKTLNKYRARIKIDRKDKSLGLFERFEDAVKARYQEELNNPRWSCSVESTAYKYLRDNNLI